MKRLILIASSGLLLSTAALTNAHAGDSGPRPRLPVIEITPHPAPDAPDYGTCLMQCATRNEACRRGTQGRTIRRECRLRRSLCDSDCIRYGINER